MEAAEPRDHGGAAATWSPSPGNTAAGHTLDTKNSHTLHSGSHVVL